MQKTCTFKNFPRKNSLHYTKDTYPENTTTSDKIFHSFFENCFPFHYHKDKKFAKVTVWEKIFPRK